MRRIVLIVVVFIIGFTCFSQQIKCKKRNYRKNLFKDTAILDSQTTFNKDTITYKQLKFNCSSPYLTRRVMFNKLGKWEGTLHSENHKDYSILVWNEVMLLSNQQLYTVIASRYDHGDSSFIILEKDGKDALANSSIDQNKLVATMETLVKEYGYKNDQFMEVYTYDSDTSHYKEN